MRQNVLAVLFFLGLMACEATSANPVLLISVDGLRPDYVTQGISTV